MATPEEYRLQIEAGKGIVKEVLWDLANSLNEPMIGQFEFIETHSDFDDHEGQLSLVDPMMNETVTKLKVPHLADAHGTPARKKQLTHQVRTAVTAYLKIGRG